MKVVFQIVLKKPVYPKSFLSEKLYSVIQAEAVAIGDRDFETVAEWIEILYYTSYSEVGHRLLLGFALELPTDFEKDVGRRIIENQDEGQGIDSFGSLLQSDNEFVEAVFRYQDDNLLGDISKYHPEIFELEMKVREVLNYILCYNLQYHSVFDFLREFKKTKVSNAKTASQAKEYKKAKKRDTNVKHPLSVNFENELFHIVFHHYKEFTSPQPRNKRNIIEQIGRSNDLSELKMWLKQSVDFSILNEKHQTFIDDIATRIIPIEALRNDIMHNRKISKETIDDFERAKGIVLGWISNFWNEEQTREVGSMKQAEYILTTLLRRIESINASPIKYKDLKYDEQEAEDIDSLRTQLFDIITDTVEIENHDSLKQLITDKTNAINMNIDTAAVRKKRVRSSPPKVVKKTTRRASR